MTGRNTQNSNTAVM